MNKFSDEQEVWKVYWRLFGYFIPHEHDENSAPIQLFWGIMHEIMVGSHRIVRVNKY